MQINKVETLNNEEGVQTPHSKYIPSSTNLLNDLENNDMQAIAVVLEQDKKEADAKKIDIII